jgi:hypothetical protein
VLYGDPRAGHAAVVDGEVSPAPHPAPLIEMLFDHAAIRETCATEFGYDLAKRVNEA